MSDASQILAAEFEALRTDIIAHYEASGRATGNWGDTVEVTSSETRATITADSYINGRKPGKQPPGEAIEEWIKAKGIASGLQKNISITSLAYLIARKIGREGWQPKQENTIENIVTPDRMQQMLDKIGESHIEDFNTSIINYLKTAIT